MVCSKYSYVGGALGPHTQAGCRLPYYLPSKVPKLLLGSDVAHDTARQKLRRTSLDLPGATACHVCWGRVFSVEGKIFADHFPLFFIFLTWHTMYNYKTFFYIKHSDKEYLHCFHFFFLAIISIYRMKMNVDV